MACGTTGSPEPLWPDRSTDVVEARRVARAGHVPGAATPTPDGVRIGFVPRSGKDPLVAAWSAFRGDGDTVGAPALWAATTGDSKGLVVVEGGRSFAASPATDELVLRLVSQDWLDCSRATGTAFLQAASQEDGLVAVAELPVSEARRRPVELRRRAGLEAESIATMKTRTFALASADPFVRASAVQWLRSVGLASAVSGLTTLEQPTDVVAALSEARVDYVFHRTAMNTTLPGQQVTMRSEIFPSPDLSLSLLVCRAEALATHRRSLTKLLVRWSKGHPAYAPGSVDEERVTALNGLLFSTGLVRTSRPAVMLVDGALARDLNKRSPR